MRHFYLAIAIILGLCLIFLAVIPGGMTIWITRGIFFVWAFCAVGCWLDDRLEHRLKIEALRERETFLRAKEEDRALVEGMRMQRMAAAKPESET